jgi:hypothetical protein
LSTGEHADVCLIPNRRREATRATISTFSELAASGSAGDTSSKSYAHFYGSMTDFMGIVLACLREAGHDPIVINELTDALQGIARERPDLAERYSKALASRRAGEIERLWSECVLILGAWGNIRINGITGQLHVGHGSRSYPLFPRVFQIWPPRGAR